MLPDFKNDVYILSNYPESIETPGLVFDHVLNHQSLRVFYHHHNVSNEHMNLVVYVHNVTSKNQHINIYKGIGGSTPDIVFAGHKAAYEFFYHLLNGSDRYTIPPFSQVPIVVNKLKSNQTSSGIIRIEKESTAKLNVKMSILDMSYPNLTGFIDVPETVNQFRPVVFYNAYNEHKFTYKLQTKIQSFQIGGVPYIKDEDYDYRLKGNYGVIYKINLFLENPFSEPKFVDFFLSPVQQNSVNRGVFIIEDEIFEVGVLSYSDSKKISEKFFQIKLNSYEKKSIELLTMPQAGCFYPVDIMLMMRGV